MYFRSTCQSLLFFKSYSTFTPLYSIYTAFIQGETIGVTRVSSTRVSLSNCKVTAPEIGVETQVSLLLFLLLLLSLLLLLCLTDSPTHAS